MQKIKTYHDLVGNVITLPDLPPASTKRWVPNKKAIVVRAVQAGLISLEEALKRYQMSNEEFAGWRNGLEEDGKEGLMIKNFQKSRIPRRHKKVRRAKQVT